MTQSTDVAIVGAGPYGLSVAAHLKEMGVEHRIFGTPMKTWIDMPKTMSLKSPDFATNIYTPKRGFRMTEYYKARGEPTTEPFLIQRFINYGIWAQEQLVPHLEKQQVTGVKPKDKGFEIETESGEKFAARRVVMAVGVTHFARSPDFFSSLPEGATSHTSLALPFESFRGKDVAVIGAGQSALEASVMLHEAGARPIQLVRGSGAHFHGPPSERSLRDKLTIPNSVLGHSRKSFLMEKFPFAIYRLPESSRVRLTRAYLGPVGAFWLASRFEGNVPVLSRTEIASAQMKGSRIELKLRNTRGGAGRELTVDHIVAGTGYEPDLDRLPFLDANLRKTLRRVERAPKLSMQFESSAKNLYFIGLMSAFSFGPMYRFVAGAQFAAPRVAKELARTR